jgi:hypothetical protein
MTPTNRTAAAWVTIILAAVLQFGTVVWFASNLNTRMGAVEESVREIRGDIKTLLRR